MHGRVAVVGRAVGAADDEAEVPASAGECSGVIELDTRRHVSAIDSNCTLVLVEYPRELRQRRAGEKVLVEPDNACHLRVTRENNIREKQKRSEPPLAVNARQGCVRRCRQRA